MKPYTEISLDFDQITSQITSFYQKCEDKFSPNPQRNNAHPPPQNPLPQNSKTHKRPGTEFSRERSELKKVLQTPKIAHHKNNEFDVPPEQIFDLIIKNQNIPVHPLPVSNNTSAFSSQLLEDRSTQEFINPLPVLNRENSCDSLGIKKSRKIINF